MPDANSNKTPGGLDWDKLSDDLNVKSADDAQRIAYDIAEFVATLGEDKTLVLKEGGRYYKLTLPELKQR